MDVDGLEEDLAVHSRPPKRDPRYYFSDGNLIFLCQEVLYNLHRSRLTMKVEFFKDMLEFPAGLAADGQNDEHPIDLNRSNIMNIDFHHLLMFLYDQYEVSAPTLEFLMSVLKLSTLLGIPTGIKYAEDHLPSHPQFTSAIQLQLSRQYEISEWVDPGFRAFIPRPLRDVSIEEADQMGLIAYHKLVQTKCQLDEDKVDLAFNAPEVEHCSGCSDEHKCGRLWDWAWWGGFSKQYLHPENTKSASTILSELDTDNGLLSKMCSLCLFQTMKKIWADNPFDDADEEVAKASKELTASLMRL
ncbi:hypothetical protein C8J57DRAFT_1163478 [Mycena rebaudengoi]|nr:hypothetical protein C8J57DRAFT_1163478 [Mycena rebaudengoi]